MNALEGFVRKQIRLRCRTFLRRLRPIAPLFLGIALTGCAQQIVISGSKDTVSYAGVWPTVNLNGWEIPLNAGTLRTYPLGDMQYAACLSGGGYRAALFHAGVLARLNREGLLMKLGRLVGVSGGSITAAIVGMHWRRLQFKDGVAVNYDAEVLEPILKLTRVTLDVPSVLMGAATPSTASMQLERRLNRQIFRDTTLKDLPAFNQGPQILLLATEMRTGSAWVFSREVAGADGFAYLLDPDLRLATAVAASAGFPPVLAPLPVSVRAQQAVIHPQWEARQLTPEEHAERTKWLNETDHDALTEWARMVQRESPEVAKRLGELLGAIVKQEWHPRLTGAESLRLADGGILSNSGYESCQESGNFIISSATIEDDDDLASARSGWLNTLSRTIDLVYSRAERAGARDYGRYLIEDGVCPAANPPKRRRCGVSISLARDQHPTNESGFDEGRRRTAIPTRLKRLDAGTQKLIVNWGYAAANDSLVKAGIGVGRDDLPYSEPSANWKGRQKCVAKSVDGMSGIKANGTYLSARAI